MELSEETKQLINDAKNICIIPSHDDQGESATGALALFYTLKELGKNVNLIADPMPERFHFLIPSLDFISTPKNFVISIPREVADISQVYYEKNEGSLKIHLTTNKGNLQKDQISFYFSQARPDLVITLGIQDFQKQLSEQLDSFGFLLDAPILNIDSHPENKKFGKVNAIGQTSVSEMIFEILSSINPDIIKKNATNCLLTGLMVHYDHFKSPQTGHQVFQIAAELIKKGAERNIIADNLYKKATKEQVEFLSEIFQNLSISENSEVSSALLPDKFQNITELEIHAAVEKIGMIGIQNNLLVLWKSHASDPIVKGFFYSKNQDLLYKIAEASQQTIKHHWVPIIMPDKDTATAKENVLNIVNR